MKYLCATLALLFQTALINAAQLPEIQQESIDELGETAGTPVMTGFVFINGRYLPPPYTVTRRGNAIFINKYQIEQPVPWSYFNSNTASSASPTNETPLDAPVTLAPDEPEKVESIDQLFMDDSQQPAEQPVEEVKQVTSIDDLFGGNDTENKAPPPAQQPASNINTIDDLFKDDVVTTGEKITPSINFKAGSRDRTVQEMKAPQDISDQELQQRKLRLKLMLDEKRNTYEKHLAVGELYFFGTTHDRVNGTYGTARALFEVLPGALRYSNSPQDLLRRLHNGNVYFIDYSICEALYRNKTTFPLLQQRLEKIKRDEAIRAARQRTN